MIIEAALISLKIFDGLVLPYRYQGHLAASIIENHNNLILTRHIRVFTKTGECPLHNLRSSTIVPGQYQARRAQCADESSHAPGWRAKRGACIYSL